MKLFDKVKGLVNTELDIWKARQKFKINKLGEDVFEAKAMIQDPAYSDGTEGYYDRSKTLTNEILRKIAEDTIVALVIKTYQNKAAAFAEPSVKPFQKGFKISLKNRITALEQIKEELQNTQGAEREAIDTDKNEELTEIELNRAAEKELEERTKKRKDQIKQYIKYCGDTEKRPFEQQKWDFEAWIRASVADALKFSQIATEKVPNAVGEISFFYPIDASTIRFASPRLKDYRNFEDGKLDENYKKTVEDNLLEAGKYKYVQLVRGRIKKAFLVEELAFAIRNPTTNIYSNGYGEGELSQLVNTLTSHIYAEHYNKSYFEQGFSAKGILHIKSPLNRRKLESLRHQWHHMIKGGANSFQTPIIGGADDVKWIPLTQNHNDIGFSNYMNYLIKIITGLFQIDPSEIGFGMREEGGRGSTLNSSEGTSEKFHRSQEKGLVPLMRFIAKFVNHQIIDNIAPEYQLEFVGLEDETPTEALERQIKELQVKPINSILKELGEEPIVGCDDVILNPVYMQWYMQFSPKAAEKNQEQQFSGLFSQALEMPPEQQEAISKAFKKLQDKGKLPIQVEFYKVDDENKD